MKTSWKAKNVTLITSARRLQDIFKTSSSRRMFVGNDYITSYTKLINDLKREVKLISRKVLTKNFINSYSILNSAKYFPEDGSQNFLLFQPLVKYFEAYKTTVSAKVMVRKSKGFSDESINPPAALDNSLSSTLDYFNNPKIRLEFNI